MNLINRKYKLQQKASMMLWKIDASDVIMMESRCSTVAGKVRGQYPEIVDGLTRWPEIFVTVMIRMNDYELLAPLGPVACAAVLIITVQDFFSFTEV